MDGEDGLLEELLDVKSAKRPDCPGTSQAGTDVSGTLPIGHLHPEVRDHPGHGVLVPARSPRGGDQFKTAPTTPHHLPVKWNSESGHREQRLHHIVRQMLLDP